MKARIRYVSNDSVIKMNFETLEDLLKWKTEINENIIIEKKMPWFEDEEYDIYIQVYDDYRE